MKQIKATRIIVIAVILLIVLTSCNTQTTDTQATDSETVDTQATDSETIDTQQATDSETTDTQATDSETVDTQAVNPIDLELTGTLDEICEEATPASEPETRTYAAAEEVLEDGVDYQAVLCTDVGAIHFEIFEDRTPVTVNNFVFLATNGYYNNTIFHRVLADFMAQGGDPTGSGRGGPGYQFQDEFSQELVFDRPYLFAMANAGPGTNGSQFFITFVPTPHLNNLHTIFGEVIAGQDIVDSIMLRDPRNPNAAATILETLVIVTPDMVDEQ